MAWVQLLRKSHPGAFNTLGQLQGLLLPALDETSVMEQASTPVQKVPICQHVRSLEHPVTPGVGAHFPLRKRPPCLLCAGAPVG